MSIAVGRAPTVLDPSALRRLVDDVADRDFAVGFVRRYERLLPERIRRILETLDQDDLDGALDAVLSLKVASSILGAAELVNLGVRIEARLRRGELTVARLVAGDLPGAAERARRALAAYVA